MENGIGSIASKIDAVLKKLDAMDSGKAMRRAAMNKMLNSITADDNGERERGILLRSMHARGCNIAILHSGRGDEEEEDGGTRLERVGAVPGRIQTWHWYRKMRRCR